MRKALVAALVTVAACGQSGELTTTTSQAVPDTSPGIAKTTTTTGQALEIQDCSSPPVTFSALCEVYELVQTWHVDRPVPAQNLADVAVRALEGYSGTDTEPRPRTLICAVPHESFEALCEELALLVNESEIAIGPAVEAAVTAMADRALDPFTYYLPPDQVGGFRANGVVGGVGILLDANDAVGSKCAVITDTCPMKIVFVLEDNPGAGAGLQAGDTIVAVDAIPVEGEGFASTAAAIAGDETGTVDLEIERAGESITYTISRAELTVPTVQVDLPQPNVGYVRIPDFEDDIPELVREALVSLAEFSPRTIVIDLRDNPGGLIDAAVEVASEFISGGLVLETLGPGEHLEYPATEGGLATGERLIVLVNHGSASAAEIVAGALRDRRDAVIVGTNTFGKDAVQIPFELRNGGELYVAVARWSTPNGDTAGIGGLSPDRELELAPNMTIDEVVQAALDAGS